MLQRADSLHDFVCCNGWDDITLKEYNQNSF